MNYGKPCTQCGECCKSEVCKMGVYVYNKSTPPCEGLKYHDGKHWCECVEVASDSQRFYLALILGIGAGCDSE